MIHTVHCHHDHYLDPFLNHIGDHQHFFVPNYHHPWDYLFHSVLHHLSYIDLYHVYLSQNSSQGHQLYSHILFPFHNHCYSYLRPCFYSVPHYNHHHNGLHTPQHWSLAYMLHQLMMHFETYPVIQMHLLLSTTTLN